MRVIIVDHSDEGFAYLIKLQSGELIEEVRSLVNKSLNEKAIDIAVAQGELEDVFKPDIIKHINADMIISRKKVSWDLIK